MQRWIALLRGVNVGGRNRLPMKDLAAALERIGLSEVRTVIQSGNVVFRSAETDPAILSERFASVIEADHGFRPHVFVLAAEGLERAVAASPFAGETAAPKELHLFFLAEPPRAPARDLLEAMRAETERFHLTDEVFYLLAPDGIGRSKLAANVEKLLGVDVTARNRRSLDRILAATQKSR